MRPGQRRSGGPCRRGGPTQLERGSGFDRGQFRLHYVPPDERPWHSTHWLWSEPGLRRMVLQVVDARGGRGRLGRSREHFDDVAHELGLLDQACPESLRGKLVLLGRVFTRCLRMIVQARAG